jgi:hypothetical protein
MGMLWAGLFLDKVSSDQDKTMQARTPAGVLRQLQTIDACSGRTISTSMEVEKSKDLVGESATRTRSVQKDCARAGVAPRC